MFIDVMFKRGTHAYTYRLADGVTPPPVGSIIRMRDASTNRPIAHGTRVTVVNVKAASNVCKGVTNVAYGIDHIDVENVYTYAKDKAYIVYRTAKDGLNYYWGAWDELDRAMDAASDIGGCIVINECMIPASWNTL